jgi:pantetheine-phosphate adenylyltransferase
MRCTMSKRIAIYPGTFDPFTCGHLDIVNRAIRLFDELVVTIAQNSKKKPLFTLKERQEFIRDATHHLPTVRIGSFNGLLIDYARQIKAVAIIRGLRAISDFEFEFQMALMNRRQDGHITTVFLMANEKYTYLNSSIVKEVAQFGGKIDNLVTDLVAKKLREKFSK